MCRIGPPSYSENVRARLHDRRGGDIRRNSLWRDYSCDTALGFRAGICALISHRHSRWGAPLADAAHHHDECDRWRGTRPRFRRSRRIASIHRCSERRLARAWPGWYSAIPASYRGGIVPVGWIFRRHVDPDGTPRAAARAGIGDISSTCSTPLFNENDQSKPITRRRLTTVCSQCFAAECRAAHCAKKRRYPGLPRPVRSLPSVLFGYGGRTRRRSSPSCSYGTAPGGLADTCFASTSGRSSRRSLFPPDGSRRSRRCGPRPERYAARPQHAHCIVPPL